MEASACGPVSLVAILSAALDFPQTYQKAIQSLVTPSGFRLLLCSPVATNHFFVPCALYVAFQIWHKGVKCLENLSVDNDFVSSSQMTDIFGWPIFSELIFLQPLYLISRRNPQITKLIYSISVFIAHAKRMSSGSIFTLNILLTNVSH